MSKAKVTLPLPPARTAAKRFGLLEPYEGKLSRTVLRGGRAGNSPPLLGKGRKKGRKHWAK